MPCSRRRRAGAMRRGSARVIRRNGEGPCPWYPNMPAGRGDWHRLAEPLPAQDLHPRPPRPPGRRSLSREHSSTASTAGPVSSLPPRWSRLMAALSSRCSSLRCSGPKPGVWKSRSDVQGIPGWPGQGGVFGVGVTHPGALGCRSRVQSRGCVSRRRPPHR